MSLRFPSHSASAATVSSAAHTWIPCTCACPDNAQGIPTTSKTILVRIAPIAIPDPSASVQGFRAHLVDPSSGKVWVDLVDSIALLQERKATFAPRLLIPLEKLAITLSQTLADATITNPDSNTNGKPKSRSGHSSFSNEMSTKMQLHVEWIQQQEEPDQFHALVHLKCTQRTSSDQRFTWTFIATQLDPPLAAEILACDLLDPLFRVLHWQILETNHLSFQLDQAKRDLAMARSLLADATAVRERTFPPVSIPTGRRDVDYTTVFGNRALWSQALIATHPLAPSDSSSVNPSRPPPPLHAQSQPIFSFANPLTGTAALPSPRVVQSSPTLGPSAPSSDIGQPPPFARLAPSVQSHTGLPTQPPRTAMLDLLLSSSQPRQPSQSQPQAPTLNSDPYSPLTDPLSSSSSSLSKHRPPSTLFASTTTKDLFSRTGPNPSALRKRTKSPITLELADRQSQSRSQSQPPATEPTPTPPTPPPPPMSPRSLLASLPASLVIPRTVPVPIPAQGPPSSQSHSAAEAGSSSSTAQFAVPGSSASATRGGKRPREGERGDSIVEAAAAAASANANGGEADAAAVAKPKKKKQKLKGLF